MESSCLGGHSFNGLLGACERRHMDGKWMFIPPKMENVIHNVHIMGIDPCPNACRVPKDWTRRYRERLEQASREIQWEDRAEVLFWRGSDTGCLHSDVAKETLGRRNDII